MTTPTTSAQPVREEALRLALAERSRPPRPSALSASLTFGWRALLKIKHVPEQLFDVTAFPIMFTLMFTYLFGGALAGSTGEYLQFLLPGILVQTVVFITIYTGFTLNTDITKGVFDRFRSLPIWRPSVLVGALLGDAARYTMASAMVNRTASPSSAPTRAEGCQIGNERNRSNTPLVMSVLSATPVYMVMNRTVCTRIPGRKNCT